jgi:hypothetical protein
MKKFILIVLCWIFFLFGCATSTRQNISVLYQIPELQNQLPLLPAGSKSVAKGLLPSEVQTLFLQLHSLNPGLALEVGKLPEFQNEVGKKQILALSRFTKFINDAVAKGKSNVDELLKVGKPEVRSYCTPLQTIFWLLEKNEFNPNASFLNLNWQSKGLLLNALLTNGWDFSEQDRWKDYGAVTERLNAPELIDYYEKRRFIYAYRNDNNGQPYGLFKSNRGQCADVTDFTVFCLIKGGYEAWSYDVLSPSGGGPMHHVTRFVMDGKHYIMDNGRLDKRGIVPLDKYSPYEHGKVFLR